MTESANIPSLVPSETLLIQILDVITNLNTNIELIEKRLTKIEMDIEKQQKDILDIINGAFIDGDIKHHKSWHSKKEGWGFFKG